MPRRAPPLHWMVLAAILCSLAIISVADAQQPLCSTRADITMQLSEKYAEVPVAALFLVWDGDGNKTGILYDLTELG